VRRSAGSLAVRWVNVRLRAWLRLLRLMLRRFMWRGGRNPVLITRWLVLSCDGKGIVMRPEALRPATAKAAASAGTKLSTRLSRGEKRHRKRMAEVGAVYDAVPVSRVRATSLPPVLVNPGRKGRSRPGNG